MNEKMHITREDTNDEILARIIKASSQKYNCSMEIDFDNGKRTARFLGDEDLKPHIAEEVRGIFKR